MTRYAIRRSDGQYLAQEERGGFFWTEKVELAATCSSEPDAQQVIAVFRGERLPLEPVPVTTEDGTAEDEPRQHANAERT